MKKAIMIISALVLFIGLNAQEPTVKHHIDISSLSGSDTTFVETSDNAAYVWSVHGYVIGCDSDSSEIKTYYTNHGKGHLVETGTSYSTLISDGSEAMLYDDILISESLVIVFDKNDATTGHCYLSIQKNPVPVWIMKK